MQRAARYDALIQTVYTALRLPIRAVSGPLSFRIRRDTAGVHQGSSRTQLEPRRRAEMPPQRADKDLPATAHDAAR